METNEKVIFETENNLDSKLNINNNIINDDQSERESKRSDESPSKISTFISYTLIQLIHDSTKKPNFKEQSNKQKKCLFNSKTVPKISLGDYINRMDRFLHIEETTFICGLIYLDRLCKKTKMIFTQKNAYRLYFACVLIAIKNFEDKYYSNKYYAKISGVNLKELNKLEHEFLILIDFNLFIEKELFQKYYELYTEES